MRNEIVDRNAAAVSLLVGNLFEMVLTHFVCPSKTCFHSEDVNKNKRIKIMIDNDEQLNRGYVEIPCSKCEEISLHCLFCNEFRVKIYRKVGRSVNEKFHANMRDHIVSCHEEEIKSKFEGNDDQPDYVENLMGLFEDQYNDSMTVDTDNTTLAEIPTTNLGTILPKTALQHHQFSFFQDQTANSYFWQNYIRKRKFKEDFGGLRGLVWRSIKNLDLVDDVNVASFSDTKLMFYLSNRMLNETGEAKEEWLLILNGIIEKWGLDKRNTTGCVVLPKDMRDANRYLLTRKRGIVNNIPCERIFSINGKHAMISLNEYVSHCLAHGIGISWLEDVNGNKDMRGANSSPAAIRLLEKLKQHNRNRNIKTAYAYLRVWSDSFLNCWTKQQENSILYVTI